MSKDIREWIRRVEEARPAIIAIAMQLPQENVTMELDSNYKKLVIAIPFVATFSFRDDVKTTIWFHMMDHQTDSDVVIINMTTRPKGARRRGFGSQAVQLLLVWARKNNLHEVRATQVSFNDNKKFWEKNGFMRCPNPNPCGDYVYQW